VPATSIERKAEVVRRLEARVDELDKERRRAKHILRDPSESFAAEQRYKEAVDRLLAADPNSAYLP